MGTGRERGPTSVGPGLPALGYDLDRDVIVLYGGFDAEGNPLADTWEFDLAGGWRCIDSC